ncbi:MAG: carbohydrate binding domain-containing protein, partial [Prevotella sp.]
MTNPSASDFYKAQLGYDFNDYLNTSKEYTFRFKAKCESGSSQLQCQYQNNSTYGSQAGYKTFDITGEWQTFETTFTPQYNDVNRILINF